VQAELPRGVAEAQNVRPRKMNNKTSSSTSDSPRSENECLLRMTRVDLMKNKERPENKELECLMKVEMRQKRITDEGLIG
jgi:hypothetical protein